MNKLPQTTFLESLKLGFQNYCKFSGRSRRSEFFKFFCLIRMINEILLILWILSLSLDRDTDSDNDNDFFMWINMVYQFYNIFTFVPQLSVTTRRLHDIGRSGCYSIALIIPILGELVLLPFLCQDSNAHSNKFGPSQKFVQPIGDVVPNQFYQPPVAVVTTPPMVAIPIAVPNAQFPPQPMPYQQANIQPQPPYPQPNPMEPQLQYPQPVQNLALYQQIPQQDNIYTKPNPI